MNLNTSQQIAIDKMSGLSVGALFMAPGTGKTKTILEIAAKRRDDFDCVCWLAPASLIGQPIYIEEINKWSKDIHVKMFSLEGVSQSDKMFLELVTTAEHNKCLAVIDESLKIKNPSAKRLKRLLRIKELFKFRFVLNGTPVSRSLLDLWGQIEFLSPKILNMTEAQFANNYLIHMTDSFKNWRRWSRPANESALIEKIRPYIFDCDLDLETAVYDNDVKLKLSKEEREDYQQFKCDFLPFYDKLDFLAIAQKLQSFYSAASEKIKWLESNVSCDERHIIYVKYISEIDLLLDVFGKNALEYSGRKKQSLQEFKTGKKTILIMTYGTGSFGLNLQFCNKIIFFSPSFDWAAKEQAIHRVYRKGQEKPVFVTSMWLNTGLDGLIKESLSRKGSLVNNVKSFIECREWKKNI